jgi:hypothetical protein
MRLEIDTKDKTIKILQDVNFCDLVKDLENLLPNNSWKEYKLIQNYIYPCYDTITSDTKTYTGTSPYTNCGGIYSSGL